MFLQFYYVFSLWSAVALNNVELNALAFVKRFEAVAYDCAEMYEYVISAFNFDESEAFLCVKPFNCSCLHGEFLQKLNLHDLFISRKIKIHILHKVID